ncbi:SDR family NAD(P)-dependent oxidoreductase [Streptomyces cynarae]|uniref:SDR family NAD(P)-dependent oxidoreductase n=1 Tax=Streptomyces cynarae TaxID=2981134 RepID=A0ABY6DSV9_9ACTN|nr:SDR family NAD(P)-dependent oxidoreductase [Streptomyces cynarae]UXY17422.1 SDR family NAD(P)-dependent oxidoreductase [Streptomyces cynarae]
MSSSRRCTLAPRVSTGRSGVNVRAPFLLVAALVQGVVRRQNGSIVLIGSGPARIPAAVRAAYGASKAGAEMLARYRAFEFGPSGVRVNAVPPSCSHLRAATSTVRSSLPMAPSAAVDDGPVHRASPLTAPFRETATRTLGSCGAAGDACGDARGPQSRSDWSSSRATGTRVMPGC